MTRAQKHLVRIAAVAAGCLPALAFAHPGHGEFSSFAAGAMHPLGGIDHLVALLVAGALAARLGGRYLGPLAAALLGLLVAAATSDDDGWRYAAGFMLTSAGVIAAGAAATRLLARVIADAARSPIWVAIGSSARRPSRWR